MNDLRDLYAEVVMDHNRRPRNFKKIDGADRTADGFNPLCGDQISLFLTLGDDDSIQDIGYVAVGCAISKAAASMMSEAVKGQSVADAQRVVTEFRHMLTHRHDEEPDYEIMGDLEILEGVANYPTRIKCATLPLHTLASAIDSGREKTVSTE
ncbi:MAG: SUF system NifU family Fe-S cluster assembly protein [Dehalococcoidia bacterium]|nr:SUF system NifU family Fe-S cluster assembly protein [Dehalococcoidia bacterium]